MGGHPQGLINVLYKLMSDRDIVYTKSLARGKIVHYLHPRKSSWTCIYFPWGLSQYDSKLHSRAWPNIKLILAQIPVMQRRRNPANFKLLKLINLQYQTELGLRICISEKHSDWSVPGNTIHPEDAIKFCSYTTKARGLTLRSFRNGCAVRHFKPHSIHGLWK